MSKDTNLWGISGILLPWVIRDKNGEAQDCGTLKIEFKHGIPVEKLKTFPNIKSLNTPGAFEKLVCQGHVPLAEGDTIERISIEEYQRIDAEFDADDSDEEERRII